MSGFTCPYCGMIMVVDELTCKREKTAFQNKTIWYCNNAPVYAESTIENCFYKCPNCGEYTIYVVGKGDAVKDVQMILRPISMAKKFPSYIPKTIREDYEEACSIQYLSPKASATLARRCLQGMIRDFWGIVKGTLNAEISELKDKIPADLWCAIDALRQIGNIGAHMEKNTDVIIDIDPDEADKLIKLIELLMKEWYINREERKVLFSDILETNQKKQEQRKGEG